MDKKVLLIIGVGILVITLVALMRGRSKSLSPLTSSGISGPHISIGQHQYTIEVVTTPEDQARGLSGRDSIARGHGMLFTYPEPLAQSFWMKGMRFPIDIIWMNKGEVIGIEHNVPTDPAILPKIYNSPGLIDIVLEVAAGTAASDGLKVGDKVQVSGI